MFCHSGRHDSQKQWTKRIYYSLKTCLHQNAEMPYFKGVTVNFEELHIIPIMTFSFYIHIVSGLIYNPVPKILSYFPVETSDQAVPGRNVTQQ